MSLDRLAPFAVRGCLVGMAAAGAMVVMPVPEVRAACIGGNNPCTAFDPSTISSPTDVGGFTGGGNPEATYTRAQLRFTFTGSPVPVEISNIFLKGQGISQEQGLSFGSLSLASSEAAVSTNWINLDSSVPGGGVNALNFSNNFVTFSMPVTSPNIAIGSTVLVEVRYSDALDNNTNTSVGDFLATASNSPDPVPGPLPLLGAGAAFGFSRKLRRRIRQSA